VSEVAISAIQLTVAQAPLVASALAPVAHGTEVANMNARIAAARHSDRLASDVQDVEAVNSAVVEDALGEDASPRRQLLTYRDQRRGVVVEQVAEPTQLEVMTGHLVDIRV